MQTILTLAGKDLRILMRVKSGVFFTFVWPVVVAILFGVTFGGFGPDTAPALRVVAVDEDNSEASRAFLATLSASGDFVLDAAARAEAEALVRRGQRAAYLVLTPGFGAASQQMFYGPTRRIEVGIDPARQAEGSMIEGLLTKHAMQDFQALFSNPARSTTLVHNALAGIGPVSNGSPAAPVARFLGELQTFLATPAAGAGGGVDWQPLEVVTTSVARERVGPANGFEITFPQGIVWGIMGCVMTFAIGLVSERVHGTYLRLRTAPLTSAHILAGKAVACFTAIAAIEIALITLGVVGFGLQPTSYPLLALACVAAGLGFVGFMMMVAGLGRTEQAASGAGWALLMPLALFGGGMIPQFVMPPWMQTIGYASPVRWAIRGIEGAIWRDFTLTEMLLPCGILVVFGAVCFAVGVRGSRG